MSQWLLLTVRFRVYLAMWYDAFDRRIFLVDLKYISLGYNNIGQLIQAIIFLLITEMFTKFWSTLSNPIQNLHGDLQAFLPFRTAVLISDMNPFLMHSTVVSRVWPGATLQGWYYFQEGPLETLRQVWPRLWVQGARVPHQNNLQNDKSTLASLHSCWWPRPCLAAPQTYHP